MVPRLSAESGFRSLPASFHVELLNLHAQSVAIFVQVQRPFFSMEHWRSWRHVRAGWQSLPASSGDQWWGAVSAATAAAHTPAWNDWADGARPAPVASSREHLWWGGWGTNSVEAGSAPEAVSAATAAADTRGWHAWISYIREGDEWCAPDTSYPALPWREGCWGTAPLDDDSARAPGIPWRKAQLVTRKAQLVTLDGFPLEALGAWISAPIAPEVLQDDAALATFRHGLEGAMRDAHADWQSVRRTPRSRRADSAAAAPSRANSTAAAAGQGSSASRVQSLGANNNPWSRYNLRSS